MKARLKFRLRAASLVCSLFLLRWAPDIQAVLLEDFVWTGASHSSSNWFDNNNWANGTYPDDPSADNVTFGNTRHTFVYINGNDVYARSLSFIGNTQSYFLYGDFDGPSYLATIHLGAGGITYSPAQPVRSSIYTRIRLESDQTWNITSGSLTIDSSISDYSGEAGASHSITKTGAGTLVLTAHDSSGWAGGINLNAGQIVISPYEEATTALGTGALTFNGGTLVASDFHGYDGGTVEIDNAIVSNGLISTINENELHFAAEGGVTLNANTTIQTQGEALHILGTISEASPGKKLTISSDGAVILHGDSDWIGGTDVNKGLLIFAAGNNTPGIVRGILIGTQGYVGITLDPDVSGFLDQINLASTGTIGFDSDPDFDPDTFTAPIDLSAFASGSPVRLGSATSAILSSTAVITPQGTSYRFGGGGGKLEVQSALTDAAGPVARNIVLDSPAELPLTVRFTSTGNTLTGGVSSTHSAAIFGAGALPATGIFTLGTGGYIGVEDILQGDGLTQSFINRFAAATDRGMIGFDAASEHVTISDSINLAGFSPGVYLGTASRAVITGAITPQGSTYRFGAYKGGFLTVSSILGGAGNSVHIGDPHSLGTMGDFQQEEYSTVRLAGNNTYGGTTTLYTGRLDLGHANALGTGALIVQPHSLLLPVGEEEVTPQLTVDDGLTITNAIDLNADLSIGGYDTGFTLSGPISGSGELYIEGEYFALTLSGNNSAFSGGIYLSGYDNSLTLGSNNAAGTGPLGFGSSADSQVNFATANPVIGGLMSKEYDDSATLYASMPNTVLTINQSFDSTFRGEFRSSDLSDAIRVVKAGSGSLRLDGGGLIYHNGVANADLAGAEIGLQVNQGTLVISNNFAIEDTTPTVWVHGGTLALENYFQDSDGTPISISNPIVVDNGGRIAGSGNISSDTSIGTGAILSPGLAEFGNIGYLAFEHLELDAGGTLEWHIQNPGESGGGRDMVQVGIDEEVLTLVINATSESPANKFTLKIISLDLAGVEGGVLSDVDRYHGLYAWTLFNYDALDTTLTADAFDPNAFALDVSQFSTGDGTGFGAGTFSVFQSGNQIMLGFTPVPEPSTYALLALGLGLLGLTAWRQRRAS